MGSLICKLFGHVRRSGWFGDSLYGEVSGGGLDGIGRTHFRVMLECDRCGTRYVAARFHGSQVAHD